MTGHNVYRDGKVHVMSEECSTCIFKPHQRPVPGARVAEMIRETKDTPGATIVCHHTIMGDTDNAICRGWFDRIGPDDNVLQAAVRLDVIAYDEEVSHDQVLRPGEQPDYE